MSNQALKIDGMLLIGSAGANLGKTELACKLIKRFGADRDIVAIKVTTIEKRNGQCPRGGAGCGVCSSLDGNFDITRELDGSSGKDTSKLLTAGAEKVYWIRVIRDHLRQGLEALLDVTGPDAISICESNSLRQVVEPGLFLMVKSPKQRAPKGSARAVMEYADRIVVSDGKGFDLSLDRIKLIDGRWVIRHRATAIILAGGTSGRMGTDKALLPINDRSMIEIIYRQLRGSFDQILVSADRPEKFAFLGAELVCDRIAGQGPLMGIASALGASDNELNFVVACDIPYIDMTFVARMLAQAAETDAMIVVPRGDDQNYEPLFAVYRKNALPLINEALAAGKRKISDVFGPCPVRYIKLRAKGFTNLNTRTDYEQFRTKYF